MPNVEQDQTIDHVDIAAQIVCAYVSKNPLPAAELPALIRNTYTALIGLPDTAAAAPVETPSAEKPTPVQIKKSITPDALISFLDGKPYKTLKRHLRAHGLDLAAYRERYGLPNDYPSVAASYAARRVEIAKTIGLGNNRPKLPDLLKPPADEPQPRGQRKAR